VSKIFFKYDIISDITLKSVILTSSSYNFPIGLIVVTKLAGYMLRNIYT